MLVITVTDLSLVLAGGICSMICLHEVSTY